MRENRNNLSAKQLLIVDDDALFGDSLKAALESENLFVTYADCVSRAKSLCFENSYDVVLLDNNLPDGSGLELVPDILNANDRAKIILVTAFPSFDNAVQAIKNGAYDYVSKPIDFDELQATIERALRASSLEAVEQVASYRSDRERKDVSLVGFQNPNFDIRKLIERASVASASVLITGETGTGKNVIAKLIHFCGQSKTSPFISLNCAALPETLIESELFGVEKGAFTGATQTRKGIFELADGGTLFLDEIGEMPSALQAKLLSALEDRQIRRVGGEKARNINVRIIAATNAEPEKAIAEKNFRSDLFYRLSVIRIHLPPLRERREDIEVLCDSFIEQYAPNRRVSVPPDEVEKLKNYDFPGNVRELRNIVERCLILQEGNFIFPSKIIDFKSEDISAKNNLDESNFIEQSSSENLSLSEVERKFILAVFEKNKNNIARTAASLDVSLSTLKRKLRDYGVR